MVPSEDFITFCDISGDCLILAVRIGCESRALVLDDIDCSFAKDLKIFTLDPVFERGNADNSAK